MNMSPNPRSHFNLLRRPQPTRLILLVNKRPHARVSNGHAADAGQAVSNKDWLPLGVFAVISEPNQTQPDRIAQLAVNTDGVIRGNLQDFVLDMAICVAVDKKTQRVTLKLQRDDKVIVETGLYNLTSDEVPVLIHFSPDRPESRTLIRLQQPKGGES